MLRSQGWVCTYIKPARSQVDVNGEVLDEIWSASLGHVPTAPCGSIRSVLMTRDGFFSLPCVPCW